MRTNIEAERKNRGLDNDASVEDIAYGSLIPMLIGDTDCTEEVIFCESISGGAEYFKDMPKTLSLTKLTKDVDFNQTGGLIEKIASYTQTDSNEYPTSVNEINIYGTNGKLLIAALSILTVELYSEATPDQVLRKLVEHSKSIYDE